jgi:Papain family cysteine protease
MKPYLVLIVSVILVIYPVGEVRCGTDSESIRLDDVLRTIERNGYGWTAGHTSVSDVPWSLMKKSLTLIPPSSRDIAEDGSGQEIGFLPERFDWREEGGTTEPRNQGMGDCFPCWAFAIIGAVESVVMIHSGMAFDLSEQQLLDCNDKDYGCSGGFLDGWSDLASYGAVEESCYPFEAEDGDCRQSGCSPVARIAGEHIVSNTVDDIKTAVMNHGAVACGMTVYNDFSFYTGGCYEHEDLQPMNHGVVIVGWDNAMCGGEGAWIVKNSWGTGWGENGFAWLKYGTCRIGTGARWYEYVPVEPTPTPLPCDQLNIAIEMPAHHFHPDDLFWLNIEVCNPNEPLTDSRLFVVLDMYGTCWFAPGWLKYPDNGLDCYTLESIPPGIFLQTVLDPFIWPPDTGSVENLYFHAALMNSTFSELLGNTDSWKFSCY